MWINLREHHQVLETLFQELIVLVCAKFVSPMITLPPCVHILEDEGKHDETLQLWGIGLQTLGLDSSTMHEEKQASFDEENHFDFSDDDSNFDMEELVDDE